MISYINIIYDVDVCQGQREMERRVVQSKAECEIIARAYGTIGELFLPACSLRDVV
jgi:hypothetical protein